MEHVGEGFVFGDLPRGSLREAGGAFRPIGLASLQPSARIRRGGALARRNCLMPEVAHAHVQSVALDLGAMQDQSTQLHWPKELHRLAQEPDNPAVVSGLQDRLGGCRDSQVSVDIRRVRSRGLVWRNGDRLPVSSVWEHLRTTIPLVSLMRASSDVLTAFGRALADPQQQNAFLRTCVAATGLAEPLATLAAFPSEAQADAVDALYGQVRPDFGQAVMIALPLDVLRLPG